jgi:hypothetical protein
MAHLAPWTVELAGKVFAAILADIAAGKPPSDCGKRAGSSRRGTIKLERYLRSLLHQIPAVAASQQTLTSDGAVNRLTAIRPRRSAPRRGHARRRIRETVRPACRTRRSRTLRSIGATVM